MSARQNIRIAAAVLAMTLGASSQNGSTTSTDLQDQIDKAQQQLQLEQAKQGIAAAQQGQAEAQAAAFKAKLGSIDTSNLPKGTITTDDKVNIEANYLAYAAADAAAQRITELLGETVCQQNVAFYTGKDQDAIQAYLAFDRQLQLVQTSIASKDLTAPVALGKVPSAVLPEPTGSLSNLYTFEVPQPPPPQPGVQTRSFLGGVTPIADAAAAINAAVGLVSLFKVDTTFNGVSVASDDLALQALVAARIRGRCTKNVFHPTFAYSTAEDPNDLLAKLQDLYDKADKFNQQAGSLDQFVGMPLTAAIASLGKQRDRLAALQSELKSVAAQLKANPSRADKAKLLKQQTDDTKEQQSINDQISAAAQSSGIEVSADLQAVVAKLASRYQDDQFKVQQRSAVLKTTATRVSDLVTAASKADANGVSPLQTMLRAEKLEKGLTKDSYLLLTKIIIVGGNNINKKNAFWSTLSFSGGIVAEYLLNDSSGRIVDSGTVECYGGRVKESDLGEDGLKKAKQIFCTPDLNPASQSAQASVKQPAGAVTAGAQ